MEKEEGCFSAKEEGVLLNVGVSLKGRRGGGFN